jgi:hypothetical protein
MATPPPPALAIPRERIAEFLRAAFHLWTTELLPCWRAAAAPCRSGCGNGSGPTADDCVMLAHLVVDVLPDEATDRLLVGPGGVAVLEEWRPFLVDLRVLQEWAITGGSEAGWTPSPPGSPPGATMLAHPGPAGFTMAAGGGPVVVAGGRFDAAGNTSGPPYFAYGGLTAIQRTGSPGVYDLRFDDFDATAPGSYVVSGSALTTETARAHTLEVLAPDGGLAVRLRRVGTGTTEDLGFMLQITRFDGGGP